jgi:ribosomal protein S21
MSKHRNNHYFPFPREIFDKNLSWPAVALLTHLLELEHRFIKDEKIQNFFYRTKEALQKNTGMDPKTHRKYRKELEKAGIIQTWRMHWWTDASQTKQSRKSVTAFRILI